MSVGVDGGSSRAANEQPHEVEVAVGRRRRLFIHGHGVVKSTMGDSTCTDDGDGDGNVIAVIYWRR